MRTKTLLLTAAALGVAGTASLSAQVYSVNAVGYVNMTLAKGFNLIANPLKAADNSVKALMPTVPEGTTIYKLKADGTYSINSFEFGEWTNPADTMVPGEGAFVNNPADPVTVTFVGEVMQGALKNSIPKGFSIKSSMVPQSAQLDKELAFPAAEGDTVYFWRNNNYSIHTYEFGEFTPPPVPAVGEAFFVNKVAAVDWNRNFSVNQ